MRSYFEAAAIGWVIALCTACSSCSDKDSNPHDASPDTDVDADADTDADTDTDTEVVADAGPWEWTDLPDTGDCDAGCTQLVFSEGVESLAWDIWGNYITYQNGDSKISIVDIENKRNLLLPNPVSECIISGTNGNCLALYPTIYAEKIYYSLGIVSPARRAILIQADLESCQQHIVYDLEEDGGGSWEPQRYNDAYGDRVISHGGCDNNSVNELCYFPLLSPGTVNVLDGSYYGGYNSIWESTLVWYTLDYSGDTFDIQAYNFVNSEFFFITNDTEIQLAPRIQGDSVVYMDLRFGDSLIDGNWNHAAVFAYDLETETTKQITSGEWIAAYPDVYDNIVVWADYRNSSNPNNKDSINGVEIWGYNFNTSTEFQITNIPGRGKTTPRIWDDKVFVDMQTASGGNAIYMFDLPEAAKNSKM